MQRCHPWSRIKSILNLERNKRLNSNRENVSTVTWKSFTVHNRKTTILISIFIPKTGFLLFSWMSLAFSSYQNSCGIKSFNYHFFFHLKLTVPLTVHLTCEDFKSVNFDYILTSVGSVPLCCVDTCSED